MSVWIQIGSTAIICLLCANMGVMFTWPSSTLLLFQSNSTTLHRVVTETEVAMLGSLSCLGALISTPFAGMALDRLGRKNMSVLASLVGVTAWSIIALCNRVEVVLGAIFLTGFCGSVFLVVPVYITEICQTSIRGAMTSGTMVFYGVGMLVSYIMGGYMDYYPMVYTSLTIAVVSSVGIMFLRETPVCLLSKGLDEEATRSLAFYRGLSPDSKEVLDELNVIRRSLNPELDSPDVAPEEQKLNPVNEQKKKLSFLQFLRKSRATRKALFVCITLLTLAVFQGLVVVQVYAEPLFSSAIPSLSSTLCSVMVAILTVLAGFAGAYMTDAFGRRSLMIYSCIASGVMCILLGTQIQLEWGPNWTTALYIFGFTITFTLGSGMVPFVLLAEVFLPEVKSFMSMLAIEWGWFCNYIILFIFNPLLNAIGLGPIFYLFSAMCFITAIFCVFQQPETKGLTCDEIQVLFEKKIKRHDNNFS